MPNYGRRKFPLPFAAFAAGAYCLLLAFPSPARAWGANAQRLVASKAVETLPPDIRGFFEANRDFFSHHVTDPLDALAKTPAVEWRNHYLYLDRYGKFPFDALPQDYKAAVAKFSKSKLEASGVLPWQIGVYSQKLTAAMRAHDWEEVRLDAAMLAAYVAQAHDPFHTTENFDGHLSAQMRVDARFGSNLIDRFSTFFPIWKKLLWEQVCLNRNQAFLVPSHKGCLPRDVRANKIFRK